MCTILSCIKYSWEKINLIRMIIVVFCFIYSHESVSQTPLLTWEKQIENMMKKSSEKSNDASRLELVNYAFKGTISTEDKKTEVLNLLLSDDAPYVLNYPPIIIRDTIAGGDTCLIKEKRLPVFKIISICDMRKIVELSSEEDPIIKVKEGLGKMIKIGYEYIEVEWNYNNKIIKSICVVSNDAGGIIYDNIASNIITVVTTTNESWKKNRSQ